MTKPLPDPEVCRRCAVRGVVLDSRRQPGYRRRRRQCPQCGHRWTSWESLINPRQVVVRRAATTS